MSFRCGSGASKKSETSKALEEAISIAKEDGGLKEISFGFIYFTVGHDISELKSALTEHLSGVPHSGCSGEGVIGRQFTVEGEEKAISVMLFHGDKIRFKNKLYQNLKGNDYQIGLEISKWTKEVKKLKNLILLPDGLTCNFSELKDGIELNLGLFGKLQLFGGLSGDDFSMKNTYQIHNGEIYQNSVSCVAMVGDFKVCYEASHGCSPVSQEHVFTKVENNIIYEIDNRPALDVISRYSMAEEISDWGRTSVNLCLALEAPSDIIKSYDKYLIRFMVHQNEEIKSVTISSNVKKGESVWLARRDLDKIDNGIVELGQSIRNKNKKKDPIAVFHFDCGVRGKMIMNEDRKMKNLRYLQNEIGPNSPWCGFYTFGEIAPLNNKNSFHSYTLVVMAIYE